MGENFHQLFNKYRLIFRIYKELKKLSSRTHNPINNWANELNRRFSKEEIQMANAYLKQC
jgi:hypothetical protein